jgi:hypothetical protein
MECETTNVEQFAHNEHAQGKACEVYKAQSQRL